MLCRRGPAERLRSELEKQTPAVAWSPDAPATARAAEDDSSPPDAEPGDDETPWWRDHLRIEAAARVGGDMWIGGATTGTSFSVGVGGSASVAIDRWHLGLTATHYFQGDGTNGTDALGMRGTLFYWSLLVGSEAGYDFRVKKWTFRPQLGFGAHELDVIVVNSGTLNRVRWDAYFEPGVTAQLQLGFVTLGVDLGALFVTMITPGTVTTFTAHAELGVALP